MTHGKGGVELMEKQVYSGLQVNKDGNASKKPNHMLWLTLFRQVLF